MSYTAQEWARTKGKDYELSPSERWVLVTLASFGHDDGSHVFPSLSTLELETGLSERQIRRCLQKLIAVGLLDYGDQTIVSSNPRYRNDKLPKVYQLLIVPAAKPDLSKVGRMPKKKRPWSRKPKPFPVDNPEPRPVMVSRTAGQTGGQDVHQSFNPVNNPFAHAASGPPVVDHDAVYRLRAASRERLARKGVVFMDRLFAPMSA
jgi:hypothetical protein